jgi:microcystin-dependent protein
MAEFFIGQIKLFSFNFTPKFWATCSGQLLPINQNQALFSLLGTTYGGNGTTNFALPDLRSRTPIHFGTGPGLPNVQIGQQAGTENVTLLSTQMPQHVHNVTASANNSDLALPTNNFFGGGGQAVYNSAANTTLAVNAVATAGGNQPHSNMPPYVAMNFCIALSGIFPSRN